MKKVWRIGDHSQGICEICKKVVDTTIQERTLFIKGEESFKRLAGVCDNCGSVVTFIPKELTDFEKQS